VTMPNAPLLRFALAGLLGVAVPLLVACGGSGGGLIPVGNAGPLQSDFEAVAQAAENGDGTCTATETAVLKTERDFAALPSTVDSGLRSRLRGGIERLHSEALGLCQQPLQQAPVTATTPKTTTSTTPTTPTTSTSTTPTTSTPTSTAAPSGPGGGTPAPGPGGEAAPAPGSEAGGATGGGEAGAGANPGGQEPGK
jgi:hypothetical protein